MLAGVDRDIAKLKQKQDTLHAEYDSLKSSESLSECRRQLREAREERERLEADTTAIHKRLLEHKKQLGGFAPPAVVADGALQRLERLKATESYLRLVKSLLSMESETKRAVAALMDGGGAEHADELEQCVRQYARDRAALAPLEADSSTHLGAFVRGKLALCNTLVSACAQQAVQQRLADAGWPTDVADTHTNDDEELARAVRTLLLCDADVEALVQCLSASVNERFRYHFEGAQRTCRIDKPEWPLAHLLSLLRSHVPFLLSTLQPLCDGTLPDYVDLRHAYVRSLVAMARRRVLSWLRELLGEEGVALVGGSAKERDAVFMHIVNEATAFDASLARLYEYPPSPLGGGGATSPTLVDAIAAEDDVGEQWLALEAQLALHALFNALAEEEVEVEEEEEEEEEEDENDEFDEAIAARRVPRCIKSAVGVLDAALERLLTVQSVEQRARFANSVCDPLVAALSDHVNSAAARNDLAAVALLANAAHFVAAHLDDCAATAELVQVATERDGSFALFGDAVRSLRALRDQRVSELVATVLSQWKSETRAYWRSHQRNRLTDGAPRSAAGATLSVDLYQGLALLQHHKETVQATLSAPVHVLFCRAFGDAFERALLDAALAVDSARLSSENASQLAGDMETVLSVLGDSLSARMHTLRELMRLLRDIKTLHTASEVVPKTFSLRDSVSCRVAHVKKRREGGELSDAQQNALAGALRAAKYHNITVDQLTYLAVKLDD